MQDSTQLNNKYKYPNKRRIIPQKTTELEYANARIASLTKELDQIKGSLSWKFIMYLRIHILDLLFPPTYERAKFHRQIYRLIYLLRSIKGHIRRWINPFQFFPLIPYKQSRFDTRQPLISVVIPCFNYGKYIETAVDSVLTQTFPKYEIIIVEGGSTDGVTKDVVKKLHKDKTTVYLREGQHMVGDNRNYGIERSNGKYICCLDADDILDPRYFEMAIFMLETQNYDIVSTSIQTFGAESRIYSQKTRPDLSDMTRGNHVSTIAVFKRQLYDKFGGYIDRGIGDNHVPEDYDLWIRYVSEGAKVYNILEPLMLYRKVLSGSMSTQHNISSLEKQRNEIMRHNKNNINIFTKVRSKISSKLRYSAQNGDINLTNGKQKLNILFALPYTVMGGADKIFIDLIRLCLDNRMMSSVITTMPFDASLHDTSRMYLKLMPYVYHMPRFIDDERYWYSFISYHIKSHQIDCILLGGSKYIYEHLKQIKTDYPKIKIIDIQFNTDVHFVNNHNNRDYIDVVIADHQEVYTKIMQAWKSRGSQVHLIPYGVDLNIFHPKHKINPKVPFYIPQDRFIVSYIGRLSPEKNPQMIVKLAEWFRDNNGVYFLLAGPGILFESLQNMIKEKGLNNIVLPGPVATLDYLSVSNVVVVPSIIDGSPIIIKEAFAMGIPVVGSNVGDIPHYVLDGETGFISKEGTVQEYAYLIEKLMRTRGGLCKMEYNCRKTAEQSFNLLRARAMYLDVIKGILN